MTMAILSAKGKLQTASRTRDLEQPDWAIGRGISEKY
jgi:hypothetical protein